MSVTLTELIRSAPWREAITYRDTWPHEYVLSRKDNQGDLFEQIIARFQAGEGVTGYFFRDKMTYLFVGDYKYWFMTHWDEIDPGGAEFVLNRCRLYRDRRDFIIQPGDSGKSENYPSNEPLKSYRRKRS